MIWSVFLNRWCLSRGNCVALPGIFARAIPKMLQLCSRFDWKIWKPQPYVYYIYIYIIYIHMIYFIMLSTMVLCIYFLKSKIPKIIYRVQFSMAASWTQTPRCSPGVCRPWRQASKKLMLHMIPATKLGPEGRLTSSARQRSWLNFWNAQMFMTKLICDTRSAHHQGTSFGKHMDENWTTLHGSHKMRGSFRWQRTAWKRPPSRDHLKNCSLWIGKSLDLALSPSCLFSSLTDLGAAKHWPLRTKSGQHAVKPWWTVKGNGYSETTHDLIDLLQLHSVTILFLKIGRKRSNAFLQECEEVLHQRWEDRQCKAYWIDACFYQFSEKTGAKAEG